MTQFFEDNGFRFVGQDIDGERMEIVELDGKNIFFYNYLPYRKISLAFFGR